LFWVREVRFVLRHRGTYEHSEGKGGDEVGFHLVIGRKVICGRESFSKEGKFVKH
jgi:hypothetical protein